MTIEEALRKARTSLLPSEDARFDALCLAEKAWGLSKTQLRLHSGQTIDPTEFFALVYRRASGEPLQYILGEWEFYGLRFAVGPGVLIPRPETEMLVEIALAFLREASGGKNKPLVLDLCAGSGCVGLSVAHHCASAGVYLIELSDEALPSLRRNAEAYRNAEVIHGDITQAESIMERIFHEQGEPDIQLILANPPYIKSDEIEALSEAVRREPRMALDGGADGLAFYRVLAETWLPRLAPGGLLACECGEGQASEIAAMLGSQRNQKRDFAPWDTSVKKDFNGIERAVLVRKWENP